MKYLTVAEAAELLRATPRTVRRWAKAGKIPATQVPGGKFLFAEDKLRQFLQQREVQQSS